MAYLLKLILADEGITADIAYNADQAYELLLKNKYKALTLDIMLPDEDGISLLKRIRQTENGKNLPVIVISAKADNVKKELKGGTLGVLDWLNKPISKDKMTSVLGSLVMDDKSNKDFKVLHVEDDEDIFKLVAHLLEDHVTLDHAGTVSNASELLSNQHYDLVILDIDMPDFSGLELLERINQMEKPPKVVIFSASEPDVDLSTNVKDVLVKSQINNDELLARITNTLH